MSLEIKKGTIKYIEGREQHSSGWRKFEVTGLNEWACKEDDFSRIDRHRSYQMRKCNCNNVPFGTIFTTFYQSGDKNETQEFEFHVCKVSGSVMGLKTSGEGHCQGNFEVIASGVTKAKASLLLDWWELCPDGRELEYAIECAKLIDKRGQKAAPILPELIEEKEPQILNWGDELVQVITPKFQDHIVQAISTWDIEGGDARLLANHILYSIAFYKEEG